MWDKIYNILYTVYNVSKLKQNKIIAVKSVIYCPSKIALIMLPLIGPRAASFASDVRSLLE